MHSKNLLAKAMDQIRKTFLGACPSSYWCWWHNSRENPKVGHEVCTEAVKPLTGAYLSLYKASTRSLHQFKGAMSWTKNFGLLVFSFLFGHREITVLVSRWCQLVQPAGIGACECRISHPKYFFFYLFLFSIYFKALWDLLREGTIKYKPLVKYL